MLITDLRKGHVYKLNHVTSIQLYVDTITASYATRLSQGEEFLAMTDPFLEHALGDQNVLIMGCHREFMGYLSFSRYYAKEIQFEEITDGSK